MTIAETVWQRHSGWQNIFCFAFGGFVLSDRCLHCTSLSIPRTSRDKFMEWIYSVPYAQPHLADPIYHSKFLGCQMKSFINWKSSRSLVPPLSLCTHYLHFCILHTFLHYGVGVYPRPAGSKPLRWTMLAMIYKSKMALSGTTYCVYDSLFFVLRIWKPATRWFLYH